MLLLLAGSGWKEVPVLSRALHPNYGTMHGVPHDGANAGLMRVCGGTVTKWGTYLPNPPSTLVPNLEEMRMIMAPSGTNPMQVDMMVPTGCYDRSSERAMMPLNHKAWLEAMNLQFTLVE